MLKRFFAQFADVPTVGLHAVTSAFLATLYVLVLLIGIVLSRAIDNTVTVTVGTFILGYFAKASYDFQTKRKTELVTPPDVMAQDAGAPSVAQVKTTALPADLASALDESPRLTPQAPRPVPAPMPAQPSIHTEPPKTTPVLSVDG